MRFPTIENFNLGSYPYSYLHLILANGEYLGNFDYDNLIAAELIPPCFIKFISTCDLEVVCYLTDE